MNIYLGYATTVKVFYQSRLIQAESTDDAQEKLKNYYKENFPEIYESPFFDVVINETIK